MKGSADGSLAPRREAGVDLCARHPSWFGGGDSEDFLQGGSADWHHNVLNQAQKKDREALAEDLRAMYRAETKEESKKAPKKLHER